MHLPSGLLISHQVNFSVVDGVYYLEFCDEYQADIDAFTRSLASAMPAEDLAKIKGFLENYEYAGGIEYLMTKAEAFDEMSGKWLHAAEMLIKLEKLQTRRRLRCMHGMMSALSKSMESCAINGIDNVTSLLSAKSDVVSTTAELQTKLALHALLAREKNTQAQVVESQLQINQLKSEMLKKEENDKLEELKKEEDAKLEKMKLERLEKLKKKAARKEQARKEQAQRDYQATIAAIEKTYQNPEAIEEDSSEDDLE